MAMKIDPRILKSLRERQGFSQADLEGKSKVSKRQIQRLESEETRVHGSTVNRLAKALGVTPDQLSGKRPLPDSPVARSKGLEDALVRCLDSRTVLNFDLLSAKYGVTMEEVVFAAPALFAIFAERAARLREERLVDLVAKGNADLEIEDLSPAPWEDRPSSRPETSVICRAEIFWTQEHENSYWAGGENAFVDTLRKELSTTDNPPAQLIDESDGHGFLNMYPGNHIPKISVLRAELDKVTCLDPDAYWTLLWGDARLHEIPPELLQANRAIERITWLREKCPSKASAGGES